ncbi:MAG TPA: (d)CMP kinase [bacterium]|nr:(d)CMP kinase [bacterium]
MTRKPIVAIDGPAGSGKSTVTKLLAQKLGFLFIDTGAMYRAVTLKALDSGTDMTDPAALTRVAEGCTIELRNVGQETQVLLDGRDVSTEIRNPRLNPHLSPVAAVSGVRRRLVALQQQMGRIGGVVMEGRDIGTVVFPDAEVKIYLEATVAERTRRRALEMQGKNLPCDEAKVRAEIERRDHIDSTREDSPLRQADDAVLVITDGLSIEQVVDKLAAIVAAKTA